MTNPGPSVMKSSVIKNSEFNPGNTKPSFLLHETSTPKTSFQLPNQGRYVSQRSFFQEPTELKVPPSTPKDFLPDFEVTPVSSSLPKLDSLKLPFVREIGVKESIRKLAEVYGCKKFQVNLVQFWFLDFMTDCLWKVQDEFQLPEEHQKVVLEWVGYVFNLIRAPHLNLSRKELFRILDEALAVAEQHVETGCSTLPFPEELFSLNAEMKEDGVEMEPQSSSSSIEQPISNTSKNDSYLAIELEDGVKFFDLPAKICPWDTDDDCLSSTIETVSENEIVIVKPETPEKEISDDDADPIYDNVCDADVMFEDFYKPDMSTPSRFMPSEDSLLSTSISFSYESESIDAEEDDDEEIAGTPTWTFTKKRAPEVPCPSKLFNFKQEVEGKSEKIKEDEAIQRWYDYHLWQFRKKAMNDPNKGWMVSSEEELKSTLKTKENKETHTRQETERLAAQHNLINCLIGMHDEMKTLKKNRFINTCVIMAIKQIIYDYFSDSFQFGIIRLAYRYPQYLLTQELNKEWCTPKKMKGEIKRPKPKKTKVEKPKKDFKFEKVPQVSTEKPKEEHKKVEKHESNFHKVEEQKAEDPVDLERIRREKLHQEEMARIAEENRTLVFPLADAVDESFFENKFPWFKSSKKKGNK